MLRELQTTFADSLLNGDASAASRIRPHDGKPTPARRLEIYRHNVMTNLRGALRDIYPVVNRIVGDAFFLHAADQFIRDVPSRSGDLNQFGGEWPRFLSGYPHASELPYLADVARLEWCWHQSFHAGNGAALDLARLAAVPADEHAGLRFVLHPAVRLIASPFPILRIWQVNQAGFAGDLAIDWQQPGDALLVRREEVEVLIETLPAGGFQFLSALAGDATLATATEAALHADAGFDLQGFLGWAVQSGLIVDFEKETP